MARYEAWDWLPKTCPAHAQRAPLSRGPSLPAGVFSRWRARISVVAATPVESSWTLTGQFRHRVTASMVSPTPRQGRPVFSHSDSTAVSSDSAFSRERAALTLESVETQ